MEMMQLNIIIIQEYQYKLMYSNDMKFPFMPNPGNIPSDDGFFKTIQSRFLPNFKLASLSTILIIVNIVIFVIMHVLYNPENYQKFLEWPPAMDRWLLDIELVKSNKMYMYQAFTAMFMHQNYQHILGNMICALILMYQLESSWFWSIPLGLVGGFAANCLAILVYEGRLLGFSGVLACYVGMIITQLLTHLNYFQTRQRGSFFMIIITIIFLTIFVVFSGGSMLVHLFGLLYGVIIALGFYPKHPQSCVNSTLDKIFKVAAVGLVAATIVLAVVL